MSAENLLRLQTERYTGSSIENADIEGQTACYRERVRNQLSKYFWICNENGISNTGVHPKPTKQLVPPLVHSCEQLNTPYGMGDRNLA